MRPIYEPMLFLVFTASASLGVASSLLPAAEIITSLTQCEEQICGGSLPLNLTYSGAFSGFPGTQTVGQGSSVTAVGLPLPTLSDQVPLSTANALDTAQFRYAIEVVPLDGNTNVSPVQLGVNAVGTTSVATAPNQNPDPGNLPSGLNDASDFLGLFLLSNSSGTAVFSDTVSIRYVNGFLYSGGVIVGCSSQNTSSATGAGFISGGSVGCDGSTMTGGINETGSYAISSNSVYLVVLQADATVSTSNDGLASGSGSVQASEFIDPTFTVPAGYELLLSDGIGNGESGVPEPATWTMVVAGMGLLLVSKRRHVKGLFR